MTNLEIERYDRIAVIGVDVQNDFCPGGSLAVPDGDRVVTPLNRAISAVRTLNVARWGNPDANLPEGMIVLTGDQHPVATNHFSASPNFRTTWPVHCVRNTPGADFHPDLDTRQAYIIDKGTGVDEDAYSGFEGHERTTHRSLDQLLEGCYRKKVGLFIGGLATDYCVVSTVFGAIQRGYPVFVFEDAIRGVNPETTARAKEEMSTPEKGSFDGFITTNEFVLQIGGLVTRVWRNKQ